MRGVELGITLDEFRQLPVANDEPDRFSEPQVRCSDQDMTNVIWSRRPTEDIKLGVLSCGWFIKYRKDYDEKLLDHHIALGGGKGPPVFQFVEQDGKLRLFRILVKAHESYYAGIPDALTRNFGAPVTTTAPFQVRSGATFTATTLTWRNGVSTISLVDRCEQANFYCLTYEHVGLKKIYDAIIDQRGAAAASKI